MTIIRHVWPREKQLEAAQTRKALAEFRAMPPEERQRMLEGLRKMTNTKKAKTI